MSELHLPVERCMRSPVHSVREDDWLADAQQRMLEIGASELPVVEAGGAIVGTLGRVDLLRAGRIRVSDGRRGRLITLPAARVREFMNPSVETMRRDAPLFEAAKRMVRHRVHRIFVVEGGTPIGIVTTDDAIEAVALARLPDELSTMMSAGVVSVRATDPLAVAVDRLAATHHVALVVTDDGWPVGLFTEENALEARSAPPEHTVEEWMSPAVVCLPLRIPAHRAARQALATRTRTLLAVDGEATRGIVTALDFADLAWRTARDELRSAAHP